MFSNKLLVTSGFNNTIGEFGLNRTQSTTQVSYFCSLETSGIALCLKLGCDPVALSYAGGQLRASLALSPQQGYEQANGGQDQAGQDHEK